MNHFSTMSVILLCLCCQTAGATGQDIHSIYRQAIEQDPEWNAAKALHSATLEVIPQTRALFLPRLDGNAELAQVDQEVTGSNFFPPRQQTFDTDQYGLNLDQTLFNWSLLHQWSAAKKQVLASQFVLESSHAQLINRVAIAYFDVLSAQDSLRFARAEKKANAQQLAQAKKRFEVGFSAIGEMHDAQARFDQSTALEIEARRTLSSAREALRQITGHSPQALAALKKDLELSPPTPQNKETWVRNGLENNSNLNQARLNTSIAKSTIKQRFGQHTPRLSLNGRYGVSDSTDDPITGSKSEETRIALQLQVPIFEGGATQSRVREAEFRYLESEAQLMSIRRQTERRVRDAYDGVISSISRVKALEQAVISSQTALNTAEAGLKAGLRSAVDTLNARRELYRTQRDLARTRYDYLIQKLELRIAAGLLSADDVNWLNTQLVTQYASQDSDPTGPEKPQHKALAPVSPES